MLRLIARVYAWSQGADWRSWFLHGALAVPITLVFGPAACITFYLLREAEQVLHEELSTVRGRRGVVRWRDHFLDVWAPFAVAVLTAALLGA